MDSFRLNDRIIKWDQLEAVDPLSIFEKDTLSFLREWKSGVSEFIIYTSGSTGSPKEIHITRDQMQVSAKITREFLGLGRGDHAFVCMNTSRIAGKMMLVRAMEADMELTIEDPTSLPSLPATVSFTALVPLQLDAILKNYPTRFQGFKAILVGGAPLTDKLRQQCAKLEIPVYETYGMTETVTHIALKRISGPQPQRYFHVLPGITIRKNSDECLEIKGAVTREQWLTTTDHVSIFPEGQFEWLGRKDLVINSGGVKIHPEQVEKKIEQFFTENHWTNNFFVGFSADDRLGQCVTLFIEGTIPISESGLLEQIRYRFDPYEKPGKVILLDRFNETASGKLDRVTTMKQAR